MHRALCLIVFVLLSSTFGQAAAQEKTQLAPSKGVDESITVTIGGKVAGKKVQASGEGTCSHAADASIHGMSASLWMVHYGGGGDGPLKQLSLTLWRPKDGGPDQLSLAVETKSGAHRIETGNPGDGKGEGSVTILPSGPGGRLEVSGKEAGGKSIQLTIDCTAFSGVEAEGG
jgi:hypothetical protein